MKELIVKAEKAPKPEDASNWDIKVIGMDAEEAKSWNATAHGQLWTIRYVMPQEEFYPCFLLAQRSNESAAATLAQSTANHLETLPYFKVTAAASKATVVPGKEHIFTLVSSAA